MSDDRHVVARSPPERASISRLLFHICHNCSFRDRTEGQHVPNVEACLLASVDELTSVHALIGDEGFCVKLKTVGIAEDDLRERSAAARIVDDVSDYTSYVAMSF